MIKILFANLCAIALLITLTGCVGRQGGQRVPSTFTYPSAPEIVEYQEVRTFRSLSGIVRDPQNEVMAAVLVEVLAEAGKARLDAVLSGKDGRFNLRSQRGSGTYLVRFSKPGFNSVIIHARLGRDGAGGMSITLPLSAGARSF